MNLEELTKQLDYGKEANLELIDLFIKSVMADLSKMKVAIEAVDPCQTVSSAHSVKGAAGSLGLTTVYKIAQAIEKKACSGDLAGIKPSVQTLENNFDRIKELAEEYRLLPSE